MLTKQRAIDRLESAKKEASELFERITQVRTEYEILVEYLMKKGERIDPKDRKVPICGVTQLQRVLGNRNQNTIALAIENRIVRLLKEILQVYEQTGEFGEDSHFQDHRIRAVLGILKVLWVYHNTKATTEG